MPVVIFNLEIEGYCGIGSASCGVGLRGSFNEHRAELSV